MKKFLIGFLVFFSLKSFSQTFNEEKPFANPVLIYGSSFGEIFQKYYKIGDFESMLRFTAKQSIDKFGREAIINYYKSIDFACELKLRSKTQNSNVTTLNYDVFVNNTPHVMRLNVIVENDTSKIILDNLDFNLGIDWAITKHINK